MRSELQLRPTGCTGPYKIAVELAEELPSESLTVFHLARV